MSAKQKAVLMGPFVGEFYWEAGRFAPLLPYMIQKQYRGKDIKYIILTRSERFDLYGKYADILVPLRVTGDYEKRKPECFRLLGLKPPNYDKLVNQFKNQYKERYEIIRHIYPNVKRSQFTNKNQFNVREMIHKYSPRQENYDLVNAYLPKDEKPLVVLGSRHRQGFKRNWGRWDQFYDLLYKQDDLIEQYDFILCGKEGEYIPDKKSRFLDMNDITVGETSSLVGVLLVILENAFFTFGSQSAIPNISLL